MRAAAVVSLLSLVTFAAAPVRAEEPAPARTPGPAGEAANAEEMLDEAPAQDLRATETLPPLPTIEGNIDYDLSYDDDVAQTYDDGYDPQAYSQFQDTLAPYGEWVDDDVYGQVWQPSVEAVGQGFSPYASDGRWAQTEYGWTWISDFEIGRAHV